ncbi:hypothetical protein [Ideonella sp.]|uniref:hypothetical protein n=1 Tax=Ideonella sp. TaxID=1929293 RepID=UPI0035B008EB
MLASPSPLAPAGAPPIAIGCLAVGDMEGRADLYVARLHGMLVRHCPVPFRLVCFSDRERGLPPGVELRRCDGWTELRRPGMRATTLKLGLFNPAYVEFERLLYLDLTLVIQRDMASLLHEAFTCPHGLVAVDDWHHEGLNSSVMCIRRGALSAIYEAFVNGERFDQRVPGDQDFINGVIAARGLQASVSTFSPGTVESFKRLMRLARRSPAQARAALAASTIVKFHGKPRMQEVFDPWQYLLRVRLKELAHGHWRPALPVADLRRAWASTPTVHDLSRPGVVHRPDSVVGG